MKTAIITPAIANPDCLYGAERHYVGMVQAFRKKVDTEWIQVPVSEYNWETVLQGYLDCYELDVSRFDVVVSTKNPTYMAQHPRHVCWLLHQMRVFYDRFDDEYGALPAAALSRAVAAARGGSAARQPGSAAGAPYLHQRPRNSSAVETLQRLRRGSAASAGLRQRPLQRFAGLFPVTWPPASLEACGPGIARHAAHQGRHTLTRRGQR